MPTLIHIVDDDPSFRLTISRLLHTAGYEPATYSSADEFLEQLQEPLEPTCLLLDVQIPGSTGPELQDRLIVLGSAIPIVFLTGRGDIPVSVRTIKAGAEDFLTKPVPRKTLLMAVARAVARHRQVLEEKARIAALRALLQALTPREREVFNLVVQGRLNKQIAYQLGTTERTIKAHRHGVMEKTKVGSFAELVVVAERLGIIGGAGHAVRDGLEPQAHGGPGPNRRQASVRSGAIKVSGNARVQAKGRLHS